MSENTICIILLIFGGLVAIFGYWFLCYIYIKDLEKQQKEKGITIIDDCVNVVKDYIFETKEQK